MPALTPPRYDPGDGLGNDQLDGGDRARAARALDVGCGAGRSTAALAPFADAVVGLEPAESMLSHRREVAPDACFVVAAAERLPFADESFDLIAAAGSLNYVDLARFLPEAARVLTDGGTLLVYDFSEGRCATRREDPGTDVLSAWFAGFEQRFPWPPGYRPLAPQELSCPEHGLELLSYDQVRVVLPMGHDAYLRYVLSEVNVGAALTRGEPERDVTRWCADSLAAVFGADHSR